MRKVFIDCGGHFGESIDRFKRSDLYSSDFEMYCFEPLPKSAKVCRERDDIQFIEKAVWIEDGESEFFSNAREDTWGSTLMAGKTSSEILYDSPIVVKTIDFSAWMKSNFDAKDYIIVKMDIEGAEYQVLRKMIEDGTIGYMDMIFMEWHENRLEGVSREQHHSLLEELSEYTDVRPEMMKVMK
jgi:FkbM family methyltransferase